MKVRQWFNVQASADDPAVVDIQIIDFIGSWDDDWLARNWGYDMGVTARAFIDELAKLPESVKAIRLHINSPGGDVQGGINIANALREQQISKGRTVETYIDGIAASIASVIAMAGSKVHMADNALVMVHNPWSLAIGSASEMRKVADILDTMSGQIVATYQWHSPLDTKALTKLMDDETWMNADEALANGFATDKVEGLKAAASIDARAADRLKVPDKYRDRVKAFLKPSDTPAPQPAAAIDVVKACQSADCLELAEELLAANATTEQVTAKVTAAKESKAQATARASVITKLCADATLPELAAGYITGAMTLESVKAHLTTLTAKLDKVEIDAGLKPDAGGAKARIDTAAVYAELNGIKGASK